MFLDDQSSFLVTVFLFLLHALLPMKTERFFSLVQVSFATLKNTATLILDVSYLCHQRPPQSLFKNCFWDLMLVLKKWFLARFLRGAAIESEQPLLAWLGIEVHSVCSNCPHKVTRLFPIFNW